MKLLVRFAAIVLFLLTTSQRLPAPVHEIDEKVTPIPQESAKPKAKHSKSKSEGDSEKTKSEAKSTPRPSGKARNLDGPKPIYPPEAAGVHLSGTGKYLLQFDQATGKVIDVIVSQSAGSPILDNAAVTAFRQWHEDPQCAKEVTMTMTFGAAPAGPEE
jgi:TonB family protein